MTPSHPGHLNCLGKDAQLVLDTAELGAAALIDVKSPSSLLDSSFRRVRASGSTGHNEARRTFRPNTMSTHRDARMTAKHRCSAVNIYDTPLGGNNVATQVA
mmetsp:Transcript_10128/g.24239  ORF Transcript_10128/g.24239 Transcript_10128/m.24239 type:complete len:102 (+) Transcript_10128:1884-2189(+)